MVIFYQRINFFLFIQNVPHIMPDWFEKYQERPREARIFFC